MPHFSPIDWLFTGFMFYFVLLIFISILWWSQSYFFPSSVGLGAVNFGSAWDWSWRDGWD